jgi:transcriptional regulator with XRE-family HTH domain
MGGPKKKEPPVAARPKNEPDLDTYAGRVAARLRYLRERRNWTIADVQERLAAKGHKIPPSTLYAYERGKSGDGVDLPYRLIPVFAAVFGYKSAHGWLPDA